MKILNSNTYNINNIVKNTNMKESWMSTRAGALGNTFGEAPKLSQCCQQEIIENNKCSHCGKTCKEVPTEDSINEEVNKIKKLF